jgi:putative phosphoesterase
LKIGIVSDIHCNLHGLERALELMGDVDELLCLGDAVFQYRFSNEVVELLKRRGAHVILGNHEEDFYAPHGIRARQAAWIDPALMEWLGNQPLRRELTFLGKKLLMVHSTPWSPRGAYVYPDSASVQRFAEVEADFVLYGHTHSQIVRRVGRALVINPGSAGDARDHRNGRQLSCAVLDPASDEVRVIDYPDHRP